MKSVTPEVFEKLKGLTQESSVIVTGKVRADKHAPGGYELDVEDVQVVQRVPQSDPYPITLKEAPGPLFTMPARTRTCLCRPGGPV